MNERDCGSVVGHARYRDNARGITVLPGQMAPQPIVAESSRFESGPQSTRYRRMK